MSKPNFRSSTRQPFVKLFLVCAYSLSIRAPSCAVWQTQYSDPKAARSACYTGGMFVWPIRKKRPNGKVEQTWVLVESVRTARDLRQRTVAYLGDQQGNRGHRREAIAAFPKRSHEWSEITAVSPLSGGVARLPGHVWPGAEAAKDSASEFYNCPQSPIRL
jgi:hypothetical protein